MKNWKTTAAGLAMAFLNLLIAGLTSGVTLKDAAISAAIATIGVLAKDFDKSNAPNPLASPQSTK